MGNTNSRIGFVDMLAACTAGAIGVDFEVFFVDFNFNFVGQFGKHEDGTKRRMSPRIGIEGRNSHQSMNTDL